MPDTLKKFPGTAMPFPGFLYGFKIGYFFFIFCIIINNTLRRELSAPLFSYHADKGGNG
jgi:hypothetical protein